ncbi:MAG: DUF4097 domain-containing protein [Faecalibacterium sp.]|nr:DUF4097 domain-containing protein [Ruminococcus sp.]MCM1392208.1 DUF4097 domain-containing protein [Ruminococcus sp.]MCM1485382.1 DUF4097 domain-containing protein [Faecalibacterium sp.]
MTKAKKILIIIAVACIILGGTISLVTYLTCYQKLNPDIVDSSRDVPMSIDGSDSETYYGTNFEVEPNPNNSDFSKVSVTSNSCDVKFEIADDGKCKVKFSEYVIEKQNNPDGIDLKAEIIGDELQVVCNDKRNRIGIFVQCPVMTVLLPKTEYEKLNVSAKSASINVPDTLRFVDAQMTASSGDIEFYADVNGELSIKASSGDIDLENSTVSDLVSVESSSGDISIKNVNTADIKVKSTSGEIEMKDIIANNIDVKSTSGEVELESAVAQGNMKIQTNSGEISLIDCDADYLNLKSTSGDIYGVLLSEKQFLASTVSGDSHVPYCVTDKRCDIQTTSGNIRMSVRGNE